MVVEVEIKIEALTNVLVDMTTVPAIPRPREILSQYLMVSHPRCKVP